MTQIKPTVRTTTESNWNSRPRSGRDPARNTSPKVPASGTTHDGQPAVSTPTRTDALEHVAPERANAREETASTIIMLINSPLITSSTSVPTTYAGPNALNQKPIELWVVVIIVVCSPAERRLRM